MCISVQTCVVTNLKKRNSKAKTLESACIIASDHTLRWGNNVFNSMQKKSLLHSCLFFFTGIPAVNVTAHPADVYAQTLNITITKIDLQIIWEVKTGPHAQRLFMV